MSALFVRWGCEIRNLFSFIHYLVIRVHHVFIWRRRRWRLSRPRASLRAGTRLRTCLFSGLRPRLLLIHLRGGLMPYLLERIGG